MAAEWMVGLSFGAKGSELLPVGPDKVQARARAFSSNGKFGNNSDDLVLRVRFPYEVLVALSAKL